MTELPVPVEHAWCVTVDGLVVDTTWAPSEASYFGVAFETDFVNDHVESQRRYAVLAAMLPRRLLEKDPADFLAAPSHEQLEAVRQMQLEMRRDLVRL